MLQNCTKLFYAAFLSLEKRSHYFISTIDTNLKIVILGHSNRRHHSTNKTVRIISILAQLVEHPLDVRAVMGSSPLASTKSKEQYRKTLFLAFCNTGLEIERGRQSRV